MTAINRVTSLISSGNDTTTFVYDDNGNLVSTTNGKGQTTTRTFDELNREMSIMDPFGNSQVFEYDAAGNLTATTDGNLNLTNYTYDNLNRLTRKDFDDGTSRIISYDAIGNQISRTDQNGTTTGYTYDAANRLVIRNYPGTNDDSFTYDAAGRMTGASNNDASLTFTYDGINRVLTETLNGKTTTFTYDAVAGNMTTTYPGGRLIIDETNPRFQIDRVLEGSDTLAQYSYSPVLWLSQKILGNGVISDYTYDLSARMTQLTHTHNATQHAQFNYEYDAAGNRISQEQIHRPTSSQTYSYDAINRITEFRQGTLSGGSISSPLSQINYTYDASGSRTTVVDNSVTTTYSPNSRHAYTSVTTGGGSPVSYGYDSNGNLTSDGVHTYSYDFENRLVSVDGGATASYAYDPLGRRVRKSTVVGTTHYYYYEHRVIEERNSSDVVTATYVYGNYIDEVISMDRNGSTYYYLLDGLGSVAALTNTSGSVVERYEYDPYGRAAIFDASYSSLGSSAFDNPYLFTARRWDDEAGLYYYRTRHYSPELGRFLQVDQMGEWVDQMAMGNPYTYTGNNPTTFVDPMGKWLSTVVGAVVGAAVGAVAAAVTGGDPVAGAVGGAVTGALIGSGVPPAAAGAIGGAVGGAVGSYRDNGEVNVKDVVIGAAAGAIAGAVAGGASSAISGNGFREGVRSAFREGIKSASHPAGTTLTQRVVRELTNIPAVSAEVISAGSQTAIANVTKAVERVGDLIDERNQRLQDALDGKDPCFRRRRGR